MSSCPISSSTERDHQTGMKDDTTRLDRGLGTTARQLWREVHRPLVLVQPTQDFADQVQSSLQIHVTAIKEDVALVLCGGTERVEKRHLGCVHGENEVVAPVEHQYGYFH